MDRAPSRLSLLVLPPILALGLFGEGTAGSAALTTPGTSPAPASRSALLGPAAPEAASLNPGDPAPEMTLPTADGPLTIGGGPAEESYVLIGKSELSALSAELWTSSVTKLVDGSPDDVNYVFMSYGDTPEKVAADIDAIRGRVEAVVAGLPAARQAHWAEHFHYVTENPLTLEDPAAQLLSLWGPVMADVAVEWLDAGEPHTETTLGTTDDGWAMSLVATGPITAPVAWYGGKACGSTDPTNPVTNTIALIERGECNFSVKAANALRNGATAALIFTDDRAINRMGGTCGECPQIPTVMIERPLGLRMKAALDASVAVTATLAPHPLGVELMAVNRAGRLRETGFIPFPFNDLIPAPIDDFALVAKEAEAMHFEAVRQERLDAEVARGETTVMPVFEGVWASDPGWAGQKSYAEVEFPDAQGMAQYDTLEADLALTCTDNRHGRCGPWDYLVYLYLCDKDEPDTCNMEVGRWITAYWSGGRWVTDLSPILALLSDGGTRRFAFWTVQKYKVDLSLRLSNRGKGVVPKRAVELFRGGAFWRDYNKNHYPMDFEVPEWAEKVQLAAFITGHGERDSLNCAEFCNHTHHFGVNGSEEHVKAHPVAGTLMGCADQVSEGVVPNQGGTWIFGRAGWCPGQDVKMWTVDITDEVKKGEFNEITYRALVNGEDYVSQPEDNPPSNGWDARIRVKSWLVYWAAPDVEAGPVTPARRRIPGTLYLPALGLGRE